MFSDSKISVDRLKSSARAKYCSLRSFKCTGRYSNRIDQVGHDVCWKVDLTGTWWCRVQKHPIHT